MGCSKTIEHDKDKAEYSSKPPPPPDDDDDEEEDSIDFNSSHSPIPQSILTENESSSSDADSTSSSTTHHHLRTHHDDLDYDPYSDVRDRLEELSLLDKQSPSDEQQHHHHIIIPFFAAWTTYFGYAILIIFGHIRDTCSSLFRSGRYRHTGKFPSDDERCYAPLLKSWENFYTRRLYHRIQDVFNRPIASNPGAHIDILERVSLDRMKSMHVLGRIETLSQEERDGYLNGAHATLASGGRVARRCLNLGSYNYLGFADDWNATCEKGVIGSLEDLTVSCGSARMEAGTTALHSELEKIVAEFLGKESAIVYNMGFNTNATTIPALVNKGDLLISDELNHTSIINGCRGTGAAIRTFRHNDARHLEFILREAIIMGRPRTRRPFQKILVVVEGIYSMEGEYCNLKQISRVCKKYGAYLYLDEAHSIGAMGKTGRGLTEYCGVDTKDVDILMGTFSKSFGAMGGYIASDKRVIDFLKVKCAASCYHNSLSPVVCQQIITAFQVIMGQDNTNTGQIKLRSLRDNSNYFRMRLNEMGLQVLGNYDSPVIPIMLYNLDKIGSFSRECMKKGLAVVVVGFPATPVLAGRARICISATHTREDLDWALKEIEEIADICKIRYAVSKYG